MAVKVILLPAQIVVTDAVIFTDGVTIVVMVTVKLCSSEQDADVPAYT